MGGEFTTPLCFASISFLFFRLPPPPGLRSLVWCFSCKGCAALRAELRRRVDLTPTLRTGAQQPCAAFFAEFGGVAVLMLALWAMHSLLLISSASILTGSH